VTGTILDHADFRVHVLQILTGPHDVDKGCEYCQALINDIRMPALTSFQIVRRVKDLRLMVARRTRRGKEGHIGS
jgi:hypothetical protein